VTTSRLREAKRYVITHCTTAAGQSAHIDFHFQILEEDFGIEVYFATICDLTQNKPKWDIHAYLHAPEYLDPGRYCRSLVDWTAPEQRLGMAMRML